MPREKIILLIQLLFVGTGFILGIVARFFRVEGEPFASFNPKYWKPVWKLKALYRSPGYELSLIGTFMVVIGAILALLQYFVLHW